MNDIMYVPAERSRDRHLEVVFDCMHDSKYYDAVIYQKMNKIQNDRAAIKDRKLRERDRSAIAIMKHNEVLVKKVCKERLLYDYMEQCKKYPEPEKMSLELAEQIAEHILQVLSGDFEKIEKDIIIYILKIMVRTGKTAWAKRVSLVISNTYPDANIDKELSILDAQSESFYAVFEEDNNRIKAYMNLEQDDLFTITMKGISLYIDGEYDRSEQQLKECLSICDSIFWAHYYLGLIEWKVKKNKETADNLFCEALDDTNFMPQIQMALDRIKEIRNASGK